LLGIKKGMCWLLAVLLSQLALILPWQKREQLFTQFFLSKKFECLTLFLKVMLYRLSMRSISITSLYINLSILSRVYNWRYVLCSSLMLFLCGEANSVTHCLVRAVVTHVIYSMWLEKTLPIIYDIIHRKCIVPQY
jgi:hypothetical protein